VKKEFMSSPIAIDSLYDKLSDIRNIATWSTEYFVLWLYTLS